MNRVTLIGKVSDKFKPSSATSKSGLAITKLNLITSKKAKSGDWVYEGHWVTLFGDLATQSDYGRLAGCRMMVEGELKTSSWEDAKSGQKRYKTEVIANRAHVLQTAEASVAAKAQQEQSGFDMQDDVPFF